ncbi:MAG: ribosome maturation factor RimP [Armatimonadetes bacterium]|nr:ribosome maturation factor RimP [Armatimonadota bacterium]
MADWTAIEAELAALLDEAGYELIEMAAHTGSGAYLRVSADRRGEPGGITIDECAALSARIGAWLDAKDPFRRAFRLQVSSPGLDRPLPKLDHCRARVGRLIKVKLSVDGRPASVTGRLVEVTGDGLVLDLDGERRAVPWAEVVRANVVHEWDEPSRSSAREKP